MSTINGSGGSDSIDGTSGNDTIFGGAGNDTLNGGGGDDSLDAGTENDSVRAGTGNDAVFGRSGDDSIFGEDGNDTIIGGNGNDTAFGGDGDDSIGDWNDEGGNDLLHGDAGNDTVYGGNLDDTVYGGTGDDVLSGGIGSDSVFGGDGRDAVIITEDHQTDTILGGEGGNDFDQIWFGHWQAHATGVSVTFTGSEAGTYTYGPGLASGGFAEIEGISGSDNADTIDGSAAGSSLTLMGNGGDDTITGGTAGDTIHGGTGDDSLDAGAGADLVHGGDGADTLVGGAANDTLHGEGGNDLIFGGDGYNILYGGDGSDTIFGGSTVYNDIYGGAGDDQLHAGDTDLTWLFGGDGNDTLSGGSAKDELYGESGQDELSGAAGDDSLFGGDGGDTLTGGAGNDVMTGGSGQDTFVFANGFGTDTIEDFDVLDADGDGRSDDQLDVSGYFHPTTGDPIRYADIQILGTQNGDTRLLFPGGESVLLRGVAPADLDDRSEAFAAGLPCFVRGTPIATPHGERAVEEIRMGDLVVTHDAGPLPVLWHGHRVLRAADLALRPDLRPIRLAPGPWGDRPLVVSPQHGVLVGGHLVRARHLAEAGRGARVLERARRVDYHHLLLPRHAVIRAAGQWTESLFPGPEALRGLTPSQRAAISVAVLGRPDGSLCGIATAYGPRARPLLTRPGALRALAAARTMAA